MFLGPALTCHKKFLWIGIAWRECEKQTIRATLLGPFLSISRAKGSFRLPVLEASVIEGVPCLIPCTTRNPVTMTSAYSRQSVKVTRAPFMDLHVMTKFMANPEWNYHGLVILRISKLGLLMGGFFTVVDSSFLRFKR